MRVRRITFFFKLFYALFCLTLNKTTKIRIKISVFPEISHKTPSYLRVNSIVHSLLRAFTMERIPAPSQIEAFSDLSTFTRSMFHEDPPEFSNILSNSLYLEKLAKLTMNLLHTSQTEVLSDESISLIEKSVRHILFQHARLLRSSSETQTKSISAIRSGSAQPSDFSSEEVQLLKLQNQELRKSTLLVSDLRRESTAQQEEIQGLYREKSNLVLKIQQQKRQFDDERSRSQADYGLLQNEYRDSVARLHGADAKISGLENLVRMAKAETEAVTKRCETLKAKLDKKKEENLELRTKVTKLKHEIREVLFEKDAMAVEAKSMRKSFVSDASLEQENKRLRQTVKTQEVKIADLENHLAKTKSDKRDLEQRMYDLEEKCRKAQVSLEEAENRMAKQDQTVADMEEELRQKISEVTERTEIESQNSRNIATLRKVMADVSEIVNHYHVIDDITDIPGTLDTMLKTMESMNFEKQSQLCSVIDGLTRFIESLMDESANSQLLLSPAQPILGDASMVEAIQEQLDKAKSLVQELTGNDFQGMIQFDSLISAVPNFAHDETNGEFASLAVICSVNEILRKEIFKQDDMLFDLCSTLGIPVEESGRSDLRDKVLEFAANLKETVSKMNNILRTLFGYNRKNGLLAIATDYTEQSLKLAENVKTGLQIPCNLLNMKLVDVPGKVTEIIRQITDDNNAIRLQMRDEYEHTIERLNREIESLKATIESRDKVITNMKNTNVELSAKVTKLSSENYSLKEQLDEAIESRKDMESTFAAFHTKNGEIEENARVIKNERDRLVRLLAEKEPHFESRLSMAIETERNAHALEISRLKSLLEDQEKRAKEKLAKKTRKLNAELSQARSIIEMLEKSHEHQQSTIERMKVQDTSSVLGSTSVLADSDPFLAKLTLELDKCVSINGSWTQNKIMSAVRRLVAKYIDQNNERWMEWATTLTGARDLTGSQLRRLISSHFVGH